MGANRSEIEHVVVLMMENRSFDHLLGYLDHPSLDFPRLEEPFPTCPVDPSAPVGERVPTSPNARAVLGTDPDHSHHAVMKQMFGAASGRQVADATMSGFVSSYAERIATDHDGSKAVAADIMKCFAPQHIPVLAQLAKQHAVLVNWFASVPGETWPNRQFAHAATSHGTVDITYDFYQDATVFQRLSDRGSDWAIYHDGVAQVWVYPWLWTHHLGKFHGMDRLFKDIRNGELAPYVFIEPDHGYGRGEGNSQHPSRNVAEGSGFEAGEALMGRIYNALLANPALFAKTLFLITYDEHGGFFDHTPPRVVKPPDGVVGDSGFRFGISGVRVPAVAISPLIEAGTVDKTVYDHASIPRTVLRQFTPGAAALTQRDANSADLLDHLALRDTPRTDLEPIDIPPGVPELLPGEFTYRDLDDFQASLVELAGAVHEALQRQTGPEADVAPAFVPHPETHAAAERKVLEAGSDAERLIDEVVATFESEAPEPEPEPDIELA